ncbi:unnamed protein product [Ascophyllum nodosum]
MASDDEGAAEYEIYFTPPSPLSGGITISITVQLDAGADASHWKVDLYEWVLTDTWAAVGDLTGANSSVFNTVDLVLATDTPRNFAEPNDNEFLIRLYTSGASGSEIIILDAVSLSAGAIRGSPVFVEMIYGAAILPEQDDGGELEVNILHASLASRGGHHRLDHGTAGSKCNCLALEGRFVRVDLD